MSHGLATCPPVGTIVRPTAYFLAATGQRTGREGSLRWLVTECACGMCASGGFAAVNEPLDTSTGYEDIAPKDRPQWRHFALANLERVGAPPRAIDQSDQLPPINQPVGPR